MTGSESPLSVAVLAVRLVSLALLLATPGLVLGAEEKQVALFNGTDLSGWRGEDMGYWSVEDGAIVGQSAEPIPHNVFLWSKESVRDFHLVFEVKLTPNRCNAGVQFRSQVHGADGKEALGYQADIGANVWGRLYHESGRKKLDWRGKGEAAVKPEQWNRYEILAVGDRIWTAINGTLSVSVRDPRGEREGFIALQVHSGEPQVVRYRGLRLTHNPPVTLAGLDEAALNAALIAPEDEKENAAAGGTRPRAARPNFIVIMVDDMGYAGLSCFGNPYFETPELDRLAAEGLRMTDFHSSGTVCSPTRTGLLTGRYQQRAGIEAVIHPVADHPEHLKGLKPVEWTFAEALKEAGYATALVGKWHQGYPHNSEDYHPDVHGFDDFVGYHSGNIDFVSHVGDHNRHDWWYGRERTVEEGYSTHLINRYALAFVEERAKQGPFCLYVAHEAIHNPVQVPGDPVRRTEQGWNRWKPADEAERIEKYRGMTLPIDEGVGQLREAVERLGIAENTLILFFSDNGAAGDFPSGSRRWRGGKGQVYEGGHRVPFIAWWPGAIAAGSESTETAISLDVMPTPLSLAGAGKAANERPFDGVDLSPVLLRGERLKPRPLYWASLSNRGRRAEAMREGVWKLVVQHPDAPAGTFENPRVALYRLDQDPGEQRDLAAAHPDRVSRMRRGLDAWYAETQSGATSQIGGWLDR